MRSFHQYLESERVEAKANQLKNEIPPDLLYKTINDLQDALHDGDPEGILAQYYPGWTPQEINQLVALLSQRAANA